MEMLIKSFEGRPIPNNKKFSFLLRSGFDKILPFGEDKLKALISSSILYGILTNSNLRYILQLIKTRVARKPLENFYSFLEVLQSIEQAKTLEECSFVMNDSSKIKCFTDGLSEFIEDSQFNGINRAWVKLSYYFNLKISFYSLDKLLFEIADYPHSCPLIIDILQQHQNNQRNYSLLINSHKVPEYLNPKKIILDENAGTIKRTIIQFSKILSNCKISQQGKEKLIEKLNMLNRLKGKWNIEKELMSIPVDSSVNLEENKDDPFCTANPNFYSEKTMQPQKKGLQMSEPIKKVEIESQKKGLQMSEPMKKVEVESQKKSLEMSEPMKKVEEVKKFEAPVIDPIEKKINPPEKLVPVNQKAIFAHNENPGGFPQMPKLVNIPEPPNTSKFEPPRPPEHVNNDERFPERTAVRYHCLTCKEEGEDCFVKIPCKCKLSFDCIQISLIEMKCVNCKITIEESWKEENKIYF